MSYSSRLAVGLLTGLVVSISVGFFFYNLGSISPSSDSEKLLQVWSFLFCLAIPIAWLSVGPWMGITLLIITLTLISLALLLGLKPLWSTIGGLGVSTGFSYYFFRKIQSRISQTYTIVEEWERRLNTLQAEQTIHQSQEHALQQKMQRYQALKELTDRLSLTLSLPTVIEEILNQIVQLTHADKQTCLLYLIDAERQDLALQGSRRPQEVAPIKHKRGDFFDYWVLKQRQPLIIEDTKKDFRFNDDPTKEEYLRPVRSLIAVPMMDEKTFLGILRIDSSEPGQVAPEDLRLLSIIADLSATAIRNANLFAIAQELAIKDGLTGLYVHRYFIERLQEEVQRAFRLGYSISLILMDIDWFKEYNDRFGHTAGDLVLTQLGQRLIGLSNPGQLVARYGGEEFAILLPECDKTTAVERAVEIHRAITQETIWLRQQPTRLGVSFGVATFPADSKDREELIRHADQALYRAKSLGRNQVCSFS